MTRRRPASLASALGLALLCASLLEACAPGVSTVRRTRERREEDVATRGGEGDDSTSGAARPGASAGPGEYSNGGPLGDLRAVHGTIDPVTGQRTVEPLVDSRQHEPRRAEIQSGRVRQAAEEYEPAAGELPYGFRIQAAATPDFDTAARDAAQLKELFGGRLPVYVEFVDPYYKVRLGDFATQQDAQPALTELRRLGFADAWAVRTTIKTAAP